MAWQAIAIQEQVLFFPEAEQRERIEFSVAALCEQDRLRSRIWLDCAPRRTRYKRYRSYGYWKCGIAGTSAISTKG